MILRQFALNVRWVRSSWARARFIQRVYLLAALFILLNALDNIVTYLLLHYGCSEQNPIAAYLLHAHGSGFWLMDTAIAILGSILLVLLHRRCPSFAKWALISMSILTGLALAYDSYGIVYLIKLGVIKV